MRYRRISSDLKSGIVELWIQHSVILVWVCWIRYDGVIPLFTLAAQGTNSNAAVVP